MRTNIIVGAVVLSLTGLSLAACGQELEPSTDAAGLGDETGDDGTDPDRVDEVDPADDKDGADTTATDLADDDSADDAPVVEDPATDTTESVAAAAHCVQYSTRHLQASMQHTDSLAQRRASIDKAFENPDGVSPDTISWTEIETQGQIDRINNKAGWQTYWPSGHPLVNARNAVPISWNKNVYEFISGSSHKASSGRARVSPNRYVTRVSLRHKATGTVVVRVAHHAVSAVDDPTNNVAYRLAAHAQDMAMFNAVMLGAAHPVIGSGDFNTSHLPSKMRSHNHGTQPYVFDEPAHGGSHGNNLLDWIVRRKSDGNAYTLDGVRFVDLSPSDHKGVRARYTYRSAGCH